MLAEAGFRFGLLVTAFWFGFRHGIDWDHLAAITDITSSQDERRKGMLYGTLYALGHALVVLALGVVAIALGDLLPEGIDEVMTRVVGATLILLGIYVLVSLVRHGRDFRLRSRWMLLFSGVRAGVRWARARVGGRGGTGAQADTLSAQDTAEALGPLAASDVAPTDWHHGHHGRPGHHHHARPEPDDVFMNYAAGTSFGVGMIHGVGAETPTQVLVFLTAAGVGGTTAGVLVLAAFIVGLLASNSIITLGSTVGFLRASRNFPVYATVAVLTAVLSLAIGTLFLLNRAEALPGFFGG